MIFLEKFNDPGLIINLDYVISMDWNNELTVNFKMMDGNTITWEYSCEDDMIVDANLIADELHKSGKYLAADMEGK